MIGPVAVSAADDVEIHVNDNDDEGDDVLRDRIRRVV